MASKTMKAKELAEFIRSLDEEEVFPTGIGSYLSVGYKDGKIYEITVPNALQGGEETGTVKEISRKRAEYLFSQYPIGGY